MGEWILSETTLRNICKEIGQEQIQRLEENVWEEDTATILPENQMLQLTQLILLEPEERQEVLLLYYACELDCSFIEEVLDVECATGMVRYSNQQIAQSLGYTSIAKKSMQRACQAILDQLIDNAKVNQQENPVKASPNLQAHIQKLLHKQPTIYVVFRRIMKRVAVVFLVGLLASTVTVMSVEALREKFFDWLFTIFPTHTTVQTVDTHREPTMEDFERLKEYVPSYIPEGFELVHESVEYPDIISIYENSDGLRFIIYKMLASNGTSYSVNTEGVKMQAAFVNNHSGYYFENYGEQNLIWGFDQYQMMIISDLDYSSTMDIADGINNE